MTLLVLLGAAAVLTVTLLAIPVPKEEICSTEICRSIAYDLKSYMNTLVDPCVDFYEFSCGSWIQKTKLSKPMESDSVTDMVQKKVDDITYDLLQNASVVTNESRTVKIAATAFQACLDEEEENVDTIKSLYRDIGGWPYLDGPNWKERSWLDTAALVSGKIGLDALIVCAVTTDPKNSSRVMIEISVPTIENMTNKEDNSIKVSSISNFFKTLGNKNDNEVRQMANEMLEFMKKLHKCAENEKTSSEDYLTYNKITIGDLQRRIPGIDWLYYIRAVFAVYVKSAKDLFQSSTEILFKNEKYFQKLADYVNSGQVSNRTLANYVGWHVCDTLLSSCPDDEDEENSLHESPSVLTEFTKKEDSDIKREDSDTKRDYSCIKYVTDNLSYAVDHLFLRNQSFNVNNINSMRQRLVFPPWLLNSNQVDEYYKLLPDMTSDKLQNTIEIYKFSTLTIYRTLEKMPPGYKWLPDSSLREVNAYHDMFKNAMVLPVGILKPPFYDEKQPMYLNFGNIGATVGHEITHGFDDTGRFFDEVGHLREEWLSETFREKFISRSKCFVEQYDKYKVDGKPVNGTLTLGENIADCGGIRQAYLGYKNWVKDNGPEKRLIGLEQFTTEQLFFISYGTGWCSIYSSDTLEELLETDTHSPAPPRVWGPLSNMKEFAETFNCQEGTLMNRKEKCILW